jgi:hypothetical protein
MVHLVTLKMQSLRDRISLAAPKKLGKSIVSCDYVVCYTRAGWWMMVKMAGIRAKDLED